MPVTTKKRDGEREEKPGHTDKKFYSFNVQKKPCHHEYDFLQQQC
uniref:Uncharacterized protein n=1 Tax=Anguilla anguilla TaxID=7936 RepID=A0A0E9R1H5_ANGAN